MVRNGSAAVCGTISGMTTRMESSVRSAIMYVAKSGAERAKSKRTSFRVSSYCFTASRSSCPRTFSL